MSSSGYSQILRSSAISGAAKIVTALAGFFRAKIVAIYVGPAGMGLLGLYTSVIGMASSLSSMGIDTSGVREMAANARDAEKADHVIIALRRICWATGLLGCALCALFSHRISVSTFGDEAHAGQIAVLGACVFLTQISLGQSSVLRGLRKIRELALQSVFVAAASLIAAVICMTLWGVGGIVPMMVSASFIGLVGSWWFARRIPVAVAGQSVAKTLAVARPMLSLGLAFMVSGLVAALGTYVIGVILLSACGIAANGLYNAAWAASGSVVGLVLGAMGQDFYPRLTEVAHDRRAASTLIDQQIEVGALIALAPLCLLSALAPWIMSLLFSKEFVAGAKVLQWFAIGCFGRVVSWPMGYYLLARGHARMFLLTEVASVAFHVLVAWLLVNARGTEGAGMAFAVLYVAYTAAMLIVTRRLTAETRPGKIKQIMAAGMLLLFAMVWLNSYVSAALGVIAGAIGIRALARLVGPSHRLSRILARLPILGRTL